MADIRENPIQATLAGFADYGKSLKGDEKGEAQVFCDRLFQAFGHAGFHDIGETLESHKSSPVRTAHEALDKTVREAYGMKSKDDTLEFLLKFNHELADKESRGETIQSPGLHASYPDPAKLVSDDCIRVDRNS